MDIKKSFFLMQKSKLDLLCNKIEPRKFFKIFCIALLKKNNPRNVRLGELRGGERRREEVRGCERR